jgi:hypothetical protein
MQTARRTSAPTHYAAPRKTATIIRLPIPTTPVQDQGSDFSRFGAPILLAAVLAASCLGWETWASDDAPLFGAPQRQPTACASLGSAAVCVPIK